MKRAKKVSVKRKRAIKGKSVEKRQSVDISPPAAQMKFTSAPPELIVRRATEVAKAMDRLPAGALHANREYAILYNLFVVTDGAVGIPYPKVARMARGGRVTKPAKRGDYRRSKKTSARSLKRIAGNLYKLAPGAVVLLTLVEKLIKLVEALRGAP